MHSENFERFFSYYHKMIQSLENFFVSNKRDLLHFRFPVDRLPPKTRSIILKLSKREELLDFSKKKMGGTQFYIFNVRRKSRKKNSSTSFKLSTTPLRNAFHSLRETLAKFFFYFLSPSASPQRENRLARSFVVYQHHARRILDGIHGHGSPDASLSKVPLHSSRFFLPPCGFLSDLLEPPRGRERIVN